jgi:hypothetical protein
MNTLLSTAYWPNLHYFFYVLNSPSVAIEQFENFQKQSFRNRTQILTANGILDLSIPVHKKSVKEFTKDIGISYKENWQLKHWRAIISAYKNSPYFEHFETEIGNFYSRKYELLLDYNMDQLRTLLALLKIKKNITLTTEYKKEPKDFLDMREKIHPKVNFKSDPEIAVILSKPYYQTFEAKFNFFPDLSTLDLLFNTGLGTLNYLQK